MRPDPDPFRLQRAFDDRAGRRKRSGQPSARVARAAVVLKAVIFQIGRVIGVPRTGKAARPFVFFAFRIPVRDQDAKRRSGRLPSEDAAHDPEGIRFSSSGTGLPRGAAQKELLFDRRAVHRDPRGEAVEHDADLLPVAFSEKSDGERAAEGVFHASSPPLFSSRIVS